MWSHLFKVSRVLQPATLNCIFQNVSRNFSIFSNSMITNSHKPIEPLQSSILQPASIFVNIQRGMKQVGRVKRRCKDCYFVMRQERLYVMCKTHPRHKQMSMIKRPKNTWILTDATQSTVRQW